MLKIKDILFSLLSQYPELHKICQDIFQQEKKPISVILPSLATRIDIISFFRFSNTSVDHLTVDKAPKSAI
jgi:hypothetical protein